MDQASVDKARAERAAQVAEEILDDPESSKDQKLAAAKVLLPYGKSTLQSIESREVNQFEEMSEDELFNLVSALITSNPGLVKRLGIGLRAVNEQESSAAIEVKVA